MPTVLTREQLLEPRVYPGMIASESRVLRAFIRNYGALYDEFRFEERLGRGVLLEGIDDPKARADWERRTRSRPDVIAWKAPNVATIIEAKIDATLEAIWQVLAYATLLQDEHPEYDIHALVVAENVLPNAAAVARAQGVDLFLFTFATPGVLETGEELRR